MIEISAQPDASAAFRVALDSLSRASVRPELELEEIEAPSDLAKHAIAFAMHVHKEEHPHADAGVGRFVLLWDATPQEFWTSSFRVICYAKSPVESYIVMDQSEPDIPWEWLTEALAVRGADYSNPAGTTTRIVSTGFGSMAHQNDHAEMELRSSWNAVGTELGAHLEAFQDLVCAMAGLPLHPETSAFK
jgi:hypothetical protein